MRTKKMPQKCYPANKKQVFLFRNFLLGGFHVKFSQKGYLCRRFFYRQCFFYRHRGDYHPLPLDGRAEERLALLEEARSARLAVEEQLVVLPRGPWPCFGLCHGAVINQLTQWCNNISILDTGMSNHPLFYPKSKPPLFGSYMRAFFAGMKSQVRSLGISRSFCPKRN